MKRVLRLLLLFLLVAGLASPAPLASSFAAVPPASCGGALAGPSCTAAEQAVRTAPRCGAVSDSQAQKAPAIQPAPAVMDDLLRRAGVGYFEAVAALPRAPRYRIERPPKLSG